MTFIMHKFSPLSKLFNLECLLNNGKYVSRKQRNQTLWLSSTTISHLYQQWNTSHKFEDKCVSPPQRDHVCLPKDKECLLNDCCDLKAYFLSHFY